MNRAMYRLALLFPLFLIGCATKEKEMAEVEGVLTVNGKPIQHVKVEFFPEQDEKGRSDMHSSAYVDENGRFKLVGNNHKAGALIGKHIVILSDLLYKPEVAEAAKQRKKLPEPMDGIEPLPNAKNSLVLLKPRFSPEYSNPLRTPLNVEIHEGKNELTLDVKDR